MTKYAIVTYYDGFRAEGPVRFNSKQEAEAFLKHNRNHSANIPRMRMEIEEAGDMQPTIFGPQ